MYGHPKKDPAARTFFTNSNIINEAVTQHQDTYGKTLFHTIYRISFSHNYHTEKSAVQVYISPPVFITVNENTKQISD
jgi:hypothetical protein